MRRAVSLLIPMLLAACGAPDRVPLTPGSMFEVNFDENAAPQTVSHEGVAVTMKLVPVGDEGLTKMVATIKAPGFEPFVAELEETASSHGWHVGIGRLSVDDAVPSVVFQGFTGGAHCRVISQVVRPVASKLALIDFDEVWDGDALDSFPKDVDGDGTVDFVTADTAFNYRFSSYAHSWAPPRIINVASDRTVDVSARAGFRSLFEQFSRDSRAACVDSSNIQPAGSCAGYVASEARLGRGDAAFKFVMQHDVGISSEDLPEGCDVARIDYECPAGNERRFSTFAAALLWFLGEQGYLNQG